MQKTFGGNAIGNVASQKSTTLLRLDDFRPLITSENLT